MPFSAVNTAYYRHSPATFFHVKVNYKLLGVAESIDEKKVQLQAVFAAFPGFVSSKLSNK